MTNPVSRTAYYCTGVRMLDAQSRNPLVGDDWAEPFLGEEGRAVFERFRDLVDPNGSNITRHWLIDRLLAERLAADPARRVILVGAGFDSRALRLEGGRWIEVDEPAVIERKEALAPAARSPNALTRIAIDFARESLADKLAPYASDEPTTVVMEGVMYYLEPAAIEQTLATLHRLFPRHELLCDLQTREFVERWAKKVIARIGTLGAKWRFHPDDPVGAIEALGYRARETTSIPLRAAELKRIRIPAWVLRRWLPSLREGYRLCVFERR